MDLHKENIYKVKAENMYLMAENHALKEENNDIKRRLKAAEDLSEQQKTEVSLLKAKIIAFKEEKISKIRKSRNSSSYNESVTETQNNQPGAFAPSFTDLKPQFNWQTSPSGQHQFENNSPVFDDVAETEKSPEEKMAFFNDLIEKNKRKSTSADAAETKKIPEEKMAEFFNDLIEKNKRKSTSGSKATVINEKDEGLCSYNL